MSGTEQKFAKKAKVTYFFCITNLTTASGSQNVKPNF